MGGVGVVRLRNCFHRSPDKECRGLSVLLLRILGFLLGWPQSCLFLSRTGPLGIVHFSRRLPPPASRSLEDEACLHGKFQVCGPEMEVVSVSNGSRKLRFPEELHGGHTLFLPHLSGVAT
jgi:hypothetical protein